MLGHNVKKMRRDGDVVGLVDLALGDHGHHNTAAAEAVVELAGPLVHSLLRQRALWWQERSDERAARAAVLLGRLATAEAVTALDEVFASLPQRTLEPDDPGDKHALTMLLAVVQAWLSVVDPSLAQHPEKQQQNEAAAVVRRGASAIAELGAQARAKLGVAAPPPGPPPPAKPARPAEPAAKPQTVTVQCETCGATHVVPIDRAGKYGRCKCGNMVYVPPVEPPAPPAKPAAPAVGPAKKLTCARCGGPAWSSQEFYRQCDFADLNVDRATGKLLLPVADAAGALHDLQHTVTHGAAALQSKFEALESHRGFRCRGCGAIHCLSCLATHGLPQASGGYACPGCGGLFERVE